MPLPIGILCSSKACGGLELNVVRMADWLTRSGIKAVLIGSAHSEIRRRSRRAHLPFRAIGAMRKHFGLRAVFALRKTIRKNKITTLVVNTSVDLLHAMIARIGLRPCVRIVYVQHMQIGVSKRDFYHTWLYRRIAAWISPLQFLTHQVVARTRIAPDKIHEIPFGIDLDHFIEQKPCQTRARLKLGLPLKGLIAGVVGRLDVQKNQGMLLRSAARIIGSGVPLSVILVGSNTLDENTDYRGELENLCNELGIGDSVFFIPFLEEVNLAYAAMDIFVLTSLSETFGMVTIEAMAAGLPVVATRSGGTPELVDEKQTGFLFDAKNDLELESALRLLCKYPALRREFGRAGRRKAVEKYSHLQQVTKLSAVVSAS